MTVTTKSHAQIPGYEDHTKAEQRINAEITKNRAIKFESPIAATDFVEAALAGEDFPKEPHFHNEELMAERLNAAARAQMLKDALKDVQERKRGLIRKNSEFALGYLRAELATLMDDVRANDEALGNVRTAEQVLAANDPQVLSAWRASEGLVARYVEIRGLQHSFTAPGLGDGQNFMSLKSLGFNSSGEILRGFDFSKLKDEIGTFFRTRPTGENSGYNWTSFTISSHDILGDRRNRLDVKYWDTEVQKRVDQIAAQGGKTIAELNGIETLRGKSPAAALYVDANDGYAMVLKAGSSVSPTGAILDNGDWVEKAVYDELPDTCKVKKYDVLLSSTGDGTLGKSAVYDLDSPAVADGHITVIRVDHSVVDPYFLADYLRKGFGRVQSNRLFTGSTGLIELTPEDVETIVVPTFLAIEDQKLKSKELRAVETTAAAAIEEAHETVHQKQTEFAGFDLAEVVEDEEL